MPLNPTVVITDRSIASLSGSSQSLMAANPYRNILIINNVGADNVGVNLIGGTAAIGSAGTITIVPNGSLILDTTAPEQAITVIGTAAQPITAYEG